MAVTSLQRHRETLNVIVLEEIESRRRSLKLNGKKSDMQGVSDD